VVANGALLYSHVLIQGMEASHSLSMSAANQLKGSIISAYTLQRNFFDGNPMALVWVLFVSVLASMKNSPEGI
jgi:hypothetical protein